MRREALENVAKDWCLTVRASQVIPVYPLSEDVQPGDLFLVTTPVTKQADDYRKKGFLPMEFHLARLEDISYSAMYANRYGSGDNSKFPSLWQFPSGQMPGTTTVTTTTKIPTTTTTVVEGPADAKRTTTTTVTEGEAQQVVQTRTTQHAWASAPAAYFPSYSFEVRSGQSLALAIPVQAVPIALSVMNTDAAKGTVQFSDARTFGVPEDEITRAVKKWSVDPEVSTQLAAYKALNPHGTIYVRAVSRVYLLSAVDVMLTNDRATGVSAAGGMGVGDAPATGSTELTIGNATANFDRVRQLNASLQATPGGRVSLSSASSRSVSARERFERPLVLGYRAVDYPVLDGGRLGHPIATLKQLDDKADYNPEGGPTIAQLRGFEALNLIGAMKEDEAKAKTLSEAAAAIGNDFETEYKRQLATPMSTGKVALPLNAMENAINVYALSKPDADWVIAEALMKAWRKNREP
jgi:hypothetical protein